MKTGPKPLTRAQAFQVLLKEAIAEGDCLLIKGRRSVGIGYKRIRADHKDYYVHRLSYEEYHQVTLTEDDIIRHFCDRPNCIAEEHLIKGTHADNVADKVSKGRHCFGERHYRTHLTEDDIRAIRASNCSHELLAADYGVGRVAITQIKNGYSWKHVE